MIFITVLKKIAKGIKVVAVGVAHGFTALFGNDEQAKEAAKTFAEGSLALVRTAAGHIAVKVVSELANGALTNDQKRASALVEIPAMAAAEGIALAESEVRLLIEVALAFIKGKITVTTAPASLPA